MTGGREGHKQRLSLESQGVISFPSKGEGKEPDLGAWLD